MAMKVISVKCPECGASLPIEEGRTQMFYSYCGSNIIITNENEYIYRYIDEAEVKKAETENTIKMRKLKMEEENHEFQKMIRFLIGVTVFVLIFVGIVGIIFDNEAMKSGLAIALLIVFCAIMHVIYAIVHTLYQSEKDKERRNRESGKIRPSESASSFEGQDVSYVENTLRACGFTNIQRIPMNDLVTGLITRPGKVEKVIFGDNSHFSSEDWFDPDIQISITYHSLKK